jgi:sec-independent protein translocase protein TatC
MKTKRNKRVAERRRTTRAASGTHTTQPFSAHLIELRRRVFWILLTIAAGATAVYFVQQYVVDILLRPAGDQQFIYTSPGGGLNFLIQLCIYSGILLSTPVIVYNLLKFVEPLLSASSTKFIFKISAAAGVLAIAGVCFGYFFGLPSALKFLSHQFVTDQVKALIAIQSYMSFVSLFLLASALIFQAPLAMIFINRIKRLRPRGLFKAERWVILASLIIGAVISPTPDVRSMLVLSIPMIVSYQIGIALVWHINRRGRRSKSVLALLEQDIAAQQERFRRLETAFTMQFQQLEPVTVSLPIHEDAVVAPELQQTTEMEAVPQTPPTLHDGRTNYQQVASSVRVRRRIML